MSTRSRPIARDAWRPFVENHQLVAVGFLITGPAGEKILPGTTMIGLVLLWVAASLTIYTGWDYLKTGIDHLIREEHE